MTESLSKRGAEHQTVTACDGNARERGEMELEEMLRRENMLKAYQRVKGNKGAPGVDGMTVYELMPFLRRNWERIREELRQGKYKPQPVRLVEIEKPGGRGKRRLGIPTVTDRLLQQALLQVLQPVFDPTFSEYNYGFRPGRSAHQAIEKAREFIKAGYRWVVDMDLEKFFDKVNHDVLMSRLARRIEDKGVLLLIRRYLQAGMMAGGVISQRTEGTPQGGPLSPLLSNVLLDDLDKELESRGHRFVRYADDCNIYVRSERAGQRVLESVERFLRKRLRLAVNREKSAVDRPWKRKFLGYSVTSNFDPKLRIAPESIKRFKGKVRKLMRRGRGGSLIKVIGELNLLIRGWVTYFRLADVRKPFLILDRWVRRRLRCLLWRQWKRPRTRIRKLMGMGIDKCDARKAAYNSHGPWWNSGAVHMKFAADNNYFRRRGLLSLDDERFRLKCSL
jgi:RNA-directed DNA polymerase